MTLLKSRKPHCGPIRLVGQRIFMAITLCLVLYCVPSLATKDSRQSNSQKHKKRQCRSQHSVEGSKLSKSDKDDRKNWDFRTPVEYLDSRTNEWKTVKIYNEMEDVWYGKSKEGIKKFSRYSLRLRKESVSGITKAIRDSWDAKTNVQFQDDDFTWKKTEPFTGGDRWYGKTRDGTKAFDRYSTKLRSMEKMLKRVIFETESEGKRVKKSSKPKREKSNHVSKKLSPISSPEPSPELGPSTIKVESQMSDEEKEARRGWGVSSVLQIFSESKQVWYTGKVIGVTKDDEVQVEYRYYKRKGLLKSYKTQVTGIPITGIRVGKTRNRFSKELRPFRLGRKLTFNFEGQITNYFTEQFTPSDRVMEKMKDSYQKSTTDHLQKRLAAAEKVTTFKLTREELDLLNTRLDDRSDRGFSELDHMHDPHSQ